MKRFDIGELFDGEKLLTNQTVIVDGESIVYIGDTVSGVPGGYTIDSTEDLTDCFVMPGLIDCHVHVASIGYKPNTPAEWSAATVQAILNLEGLRSAGVVACRDLGGVGAMTVGISKMQKDGKLKGLPTLQSAGRSVCATGGHGFGFSFEADGADEFTKAARTVIKEGSDVVKVMMSGGVNSPGEEQGPPEVEPEEIAAAVAAAHARGRKVAVHAHGNTAIRRSVEAGVDSIEHGVFNSEDIVDLMIEKGTFLVPTLSAPYWATLEGMIQEPDNPDHAKSRAVLATHNDITKRAFDAGVKVAMGTDAGCPYNPFEKAYNELVLMHNIGLKTADILKIATKNGAELLSMDNLGSIEVSKEASFFALKRSPFDDFKAIEEDKEIYIKGECVKKFK